LVVGGTHSFFVVAGGYLFQTGAWARTLPWALSVPLFLSVLPAIILAGIPDRRADEGVSKKTLAVALGPEKAIKMARVLVVSAAAAGLCLRWAGVLPGAAGAGIYGVVLHGGALLLGLSRLLRSRSFDRRIDRVMVLSLSYILWFALVPLLSLVGSPKP
jgi:4-hydroxybenzoate polyprenyltransferase